jgi:hypothetical protein
MADYIRDTEYAAKELFASVYREQLTVSDYQKRRDNIKHHMDLMQHLFLAVDFDNDDIPGGAQQAYIDFVTAVEKKGPEAAKYEQEMKELEASIHTKSAVSLPALAATILQIAKQGISVVRGNLQGCPDGRAIGSQSLKTVIWQGRNQAMHYDDPDGYRPQVIQCFQHLHQEFGTRFDLAARPSENLAFDVIQLLGWQDYAAFEQDLRSLLV